MVTYNCYEMNLHIWNMDIGYPIKPLTDTQTDIVYLVRLEAQHLIFYY